MAYDIVATGKNTMNEADSTQLSDLPPEINRNFGEDGRNIVDLLRRSNSSPGCGRGYCWPDGVEDHRRSKNPV